MKTFMADDIADVLGIDHEKMHAWAPKHQGRYYSALNAVHFGIMKALTGFGFTVPTARLLASGIGIAASASPRIGWVVIRKNEKPATGVQVEKGEPTWVDLGTYEVAMYEDYYQFVAALGLHSGACLVLDVAGIETETIGKLEALAASW